MTTSILDRPFLSRSGLRLVRMVIHTVGNREQSTTHLIEVLTVAHGLWMVQKFWESDRQDSTITFSSHDIERFDPTDGEWETWRMNGPADDRTAIEVLRDTLRRRKERNT